MAACYEKGGRTMCVMSRSEYDALGARERLEAAKAAAVTMSEREALDLADADYP